MLYSVRNSLSRLSLLLTHLYTPTLSPFTAWTELSLIDKLHGYCLSPPPPERDELKDSTSLNATKLHHCSPKTNTKHTHNPPNHTHSLLTSHPHLPPKQGLWQHGNAYAPQGVHRTAKAQQNAKPYTK